ncbi:nitroreductase/quinone reductase family protein [Gordonia sp. 'Campus']|uniref:nitroreductase/quinone reductase family protein n=1 Tax=Gordonia sp. 'Campus' TaxID=2915824 RepID=UPI001EE3EE7D|nr:nitroreductase/quinone reductase family protein [Gordonia sp. 'Campus']
MSLSLRSLSLWYQRRINARTVTRIRNKSGSMWGMEMLVLGAEERATAWDRVVDAQPRYAKYQKKSAREYPLVRLEPITG